jgi:HK97 family phage portal protein
MGWKEKVFGPGPGLRAEYRAGFANPSNDLLDAWGGNKSYAGHSVTADKAFRLGPVFAAVSILSETMGAMPLKVYREVDEGGQKIEARNHRAWRMLHDKPNSMMVAHNFWATTQAHLLLWGNAFLAKGRDPATGLVEELHHLHPTCVEVETNGVQKRYFYTAPGSAERRPIPEQDVCHIMGLSLNGVTGESVIKCVNLFGVAMAREEFEGKFYQQGAKLKGVVEYPGRISRKPEDLERMRQQWRVAYGGTGAHDTAVLEDGATFKALTMPLEDMQFVENQQLSRTDIAIAFRIPPSFLGGTTGDSLTYTTKEANTSQLAQLAIMPWANIIQRTLSADSGIFPQSGDAIGALFCEFVLEQLLQADKKAQAEWYKIMHEIGVIDADYIASRENLPKPPAKPKPPAIVNPNQNGSETSNGSTTLPSDALENTLRSP